MQNNADHSHKISKFQRGLEFIMFHYLSSSIHHHITSYTKFIYDKINLPQLHYRRPRIYYNVIQLHLHALAAKFKFIRFLKSNQKKWYINSNDKCNLVCIILKPPMSPQCTPRNFKTHFFHIATTTTLNILSDDASYDARLLIPHICTVIIQPSCCNHNKL